MKLRNSIILIVIIISSWSCSKSFLEIEPSGRLTIDKLFSDMEGLRAAMNGTYKLMADFYTGYFPLYGDMASDHVILDQTRETLIKPLYNYQSDPLLDATPMLYIWESGFAILDNTNRILKAIPSLRASFPASVNEIDSIEGQALIFRALSHFDLSRAYSQTYTYTDNATHLGVPLLTGTPSPGQAVIRDNMKNTYDFIIKDLEKAILLLQPFSRHDNYTASRITAWGLLSRIYLYKHDWDSSIAYSDSVILKSGLNLTTASNYKSMYSAFEGSGNEVIWQLYFKGRNGSVIGRQYLQNISASKKLMDLFSTDDVRKTLFYSEDSTYKYVGDALTPEPLVPVNPKVLRLSEIYLNRAEAYWNKQNYSQAISDVKLVAQRAHQNSTVTIPTDPALLFRYIDDERSRELCFEGHRLYDITRRHQNLVRGNDCTSTTCSLDFPNNRFILPIPQAELDANKAMQPNPGVNQ